VGKKAGGSVDETPPPSDSEAGRPEPAGDQPPVNRAQVAVEPEPEAPLTVEEIVTATPQSPVPADPRSIALVTALMRFREALSSSSLSLPLEVVGVDTARRTVRGMLDQLDDYVLPRLVQLDAPVLTVVGGSTGAGKSTLVNSLVGDVVTEPGVLRPTTRSPVLVHNPADSDWFTGDRVLPSLPRSTGSTPGGMDPGSLRLVAADTIPQGLAILDAPDIDSVVEANRELAAQLLAAADLWLFVTTSARYADAVPWDFLRDAAERSTAVAVVLDRVPAESLDDVTGHLAHMLLDRGLGDSPMFSIPETVTDDLGMLPKDTVSTIYGWLVMLAADANARAAVIRRTLEGAVKQMVRKTPAYTAAVQTQADTSAELRAAVETAYARAVSDIEKGTRDGTMLRGEVLARWTEFIGTGELLKSLQSRVGRARDKIKNSLKGRPEASEEDLTVAVETGLEALLREHAEAAAERAEESWQSTTAGRHLLEGGSRDIGRSSKAFSRDAAHAIREWQGHVLELVRHEGADKRATARVLSYGVNGLGIALMIVVFASTAGIPTGAEVGVGAGTAVVGQKLLEAVFGDQAVRSLAQQARQDLDRRVRELMDKEMSRFLQLLDAHPVDPDAPRRLTEAVRAVEDCT
jgi:energy-coupling factor transporter ATP-binding protein EcfA2